MPRGGPAGIPADLTEWLRYLQEIGVRELRFSPVSGDRPGQAAEAAAPKLNAVISYIVEHIDERKLS